MNRRKYIIALLFIAQPFIQSCSVLSIPNHENKANSCNSANQSNISIDKKSSLKIADTLAREGDNNFLSKNYQDASTCYKKAIDIRSQTLDSRDTSLLKSLYNLATIEEAREDYNKAQLTYKKALNILKNQPRTKRSKFNKFLGFLAAIHYQKNTNNSEKNLQGLLIAFNQIQDPHNIRVAAIHHQLANRFLKRKDFQESEKAFKTALSILSQITGSTHPYYAKILKDYAKLLLSMEKTKQAEKLQLQSKLILNSYPKKRHTKLYQ